MATKTHLRWKRQAAETGLRAVCASPRGWDLHDGTTEYASVNPNGGGWQSKQNGWYWVAYEGGQYKNTCNEPVETPEQAKADAMAYVKAHMTAPTTDKREV